METIVKTYVKKDLIKKTEEPKKLSKVGEFRRTNKDFVQILDMRAVMK